MVTKNQVTKEQLRQMAEELLNLNPLYKRYEKLKEQVKAGLQQFKMTEYEVDGLGMVELQSSERITVPPALARQVLGPELASKVIQTEEIVPNDLIKALVKMNDITEAQRNDLYGAAEKTPMISLSVKPAK